jgi:hypothetical protein
MLLDPPCQHDHSGWLPLNLFEGHDVWLSHYPCTLHDRFEVF